jgi:DNA (cytosine-5)-methyltransferase 1
MGASNGMGLLTGISLFSGAGGLDLAAKRAGIRTVCYVERDPYAQGVLMSRIRDGGLDDAPIWDDVTTFDGNPWRGKVDIVFGGFPCQAFSTAARGRNIAPDLSGEMLRVIDESRPCFILAENVSGSKRIWGDIKSHLAGIGYICDGPRATRASDVGALHPRLRRWLTAYSNDKGESDVRFNDEVGGLEANGPIRVGPGWEVHPGNIGVSNGLAFAMERFRLTGNGVVPEQAYPEFAKIVNLGAAMLAQTRTAKASQ